MTHIPTSSDPKSIWNNLEFVGFLDRIRTNHPTLFASISDENDEAYYLFAAVQNRIRYYNDTEDHALHIFCVPVKLNKK